jgi:hypothetical protein
LFDQLTVEEHARLYALLKGQSTVLQALLGSDAEILDALITKVSN